MCGIGGIFGAEIGGEELAAALARLSAAMVDRGPDDGGVELALAWGAGLAVRRLALVDLAGGRQPAANEDGGVLVALNGEIYNHAALRDELAARGHRFRSRGDAEVIAHLYELAGDDAVERLRGMFALAILDRARGRLLLARDGAGMKPLYVAEARGGLAFASAARALFAAGWATPRPSAEALRGCLAAGFVAPGASVFAGLGRLRPGELLVAERGTVTRRRFWQHRVAAPGPPRREEELAEELEALLRSAVRSHLAADVPVGAMLSGGWDSSLVATFAAAETPRLKTFSIVFPDSPGFDEGPHARRVAAAIGSEHHVVEFRPSAVLARLPRVVRDLEEPTLNVSPGVRDVLHELAAGEVKAAIGGEGADELFGGYPNVGTTYPYRLRPLVPRGLARALVSPAAGDRCERALRFLAAGDERLADAELQRHLSPRWIARLLDPELLAGHVDDGGDLAPVLVPEAFAASCVDLQQRRLGFDLHGRLPESILWMTDKTSMAHSLEVRAPFLDRDVIDFAARLPSRFKHDGTTAKRILRPLARRFLPPEIAARRKAGLRYPPDLWWRPALRREVAALVLDSGARTPFRRAAVERLLGGRMPRGGWSERVVSSIAMLQLWWTQFIAPA